jgi:hypothetical protein
MTTYEEQFKALFGEPLFHKSTSTQLKFICPYCGKKAMSCNVAAGIYHCWHCDQSGRLEGGYSDSKVVEVEINHENQEKLINYIVDTSSLIDIHKNYLLRRGVANPDRYKIRTVPFQIGKILLQRYTPDFLISTGLFYQTEEGMVPHGCLGSRRILIPHWNEAEIVSCKSREDPLSSKEKGIPYIAAPGKRSSFGLWHKEIFGTDLILTEGELKAIVAAEFGFSACAVSGLGGVRPSITQVANLIKNYGIKRLFVIFDSDPSYLSKPALIINLSRLSTAFRSMCAIVFLPQVDNQKMDLDSFLIQYGDSELINLMEDTWYEREKNHRLIKHLMSKMQLSTKKSLPMHRF